MFSKHQNNIEKKVYKYRTGNLSQIEKKHNKDRIQEAVKIQIFIVFI